MLGSPPCEVSNVILVLKFKTSFFGCGWRSVWNPMGNLDVFLWWLKSSISQVLARFFKSSLTLRPPKKLGVTKDCSFWELTMYIYIWCNRYVDYIIWVFLYMIFFPCCQSQTYFFKPLIYWCRLPRPFGPTRLPTVPSPVALWHDWRRHGRCMATMPCRKPLQCCAEVPSFQKGRSDSNVLQMDGIIGPLKITGFLGFFLCGLDIWKHKI